MEFQSVYRHDNDDEDEDVRRTTGPLFFRVASFPRRCGRSLEIKFLGRSCDQVNMHFFFCPVLPPSSSSYFTPCPSLPLFVIVVLSSSSASSLPGRSPASISNRCSELANEAGRGREINRACLNLSSVKPSLINYAFSRLFPRVSSICRVPRCFFVAVERYSGNGTGLRMENAGGDRRKKKTISRIDNAVFNSKLTVRSMDLPLYKCSGRQLTIILVHSFFPIFHHFSREFSPL